MKSTAQLHSQFISRLFVWDSIFFSIRPSVLVHASLEWNRKWMNGLFIIVVTTALVWLYMHVYKYMYYDHPFCSSSAWFDSYMFLRMKLEDFYVNFNDWISFRIAGLCLYYVDFMTFDILFSCMPLWLRQNNLVFIHHVLYKINYYRFFRKKSTEMLSVWDFVMSGWDFFSWGSKNWNFRVKIRLQMEIWFNLRLQRFIHIFNRITNFPLKNPHSNQENLQCVPLHISQRGFQSS